MDRASEAACARAPAMAFSTESLAAELQSVPASQAKMVAGELLASFFDSASLKKAADVIQTLMAQRQPSGSITGTCESLRRTNVMVRHSCRRSAARSG